MLNNFMKLRGAISRSPVGAVTDVAKDRCHDVSCRLLLLPLLVLLLLLLLLLSTEYRHTEYYY